MENIPHIEIEQMLFGDYRVQVWDENLNSMLDREYFCHGRISAFETALGIQNDLFPNMDIYIRENGSDLKLISPKLQ